MNLLAGRFGPMKQIKLKQSLISAHFTVEEIEQIKHDAMAEGASFPNMREKSG